MKFLLPLLLAAAPAFAQSNIGAFNGSYVLIHDRIGMCEPSVRVWSSTGLDGESFEAWAGDYYFRQVNGGPIRFNDEFERGVKESVYRNDTLIFTRTSYSKVKGGTDRQRVEARFRGDTLRLVSHIWGTPPTERDCTYRRVPEEQAPW